ncbi:16146_t:CDS:2, partial [Dentiscutata erythropus]
PEIPQYEPELLLRFIQIDGCVSEINRNYEIPDFNFNYTNAGTNPLEFYPLFDKYILVVYSTATNKYDNSTYRDRGMIIDWTGTNFSDIEFGSSYTDPYNGLMLNQAKFAVNSDPTKGFLRFFQPSNSNNGSCQHYTVNSNGIISQLATCNNSILDFFPTDDNSNINYTIFSTNNNDYAIVRFTNEIIGNLNNTPLETHGRIYAIFIRYGKDIVNEQNILYDTEEDLQFNNIYCSTNVTGIGNTCTINMQQLKSNMYYFFNIQFLSSGSVHGVSLVTKGNVTDKYEVITLPFGGFIKLDQLTSDPNITKFNITLLDKQGYIETANGTNMQIVIDSNGEHTQVAIFNNTIFFAKPNSENSWSLIGYTMHKYENDSGFRNLLINSSFPKNGTSVGITNLNITITYKLPITRSSSNLLIYQIDESNKKILRQNYSALASYKLLDYCAITYDGYTINCTVLSSTFNVPNSTYHIIVENGFVEDLIFHEKLQGIRENLWEITTEPHIINHENIDTVTGYLRLSEKGTDDFNKIKNFTLLNENFTEELVRCISTDIS